jgi:hypothetical protein
VQRIYFLVDVWPLRGAFGIESGPATPTSCSARDRAARTWQSRDITCVALADKLQNGRPCWFAWSSLHSLCQFPRPPRRACAISSL